MTGITSSGVQTSHLTPDAYAKADIFTIFLYNLKEEKMFYSEFNELVENIPYRKKHSFKYRSLKLCSHQGHDWGLKRVLEIISLFSSK